VEGVAEERRVGAVTYREAGDEYFGKRTLRRYAGVWSLWALGVGLHFGSSSRTRPTAACI
jgi:hypothetical protein